MRPVKSIFPGFTLIELLVVVAIIAILAAIAIPNMLEAQVRAKVARIKSDLRTVAGALETYRIDNNRYPNYHYVENSHSTAGVSFHVGGEVTAFLQSPPFAGPNPLTSPVPYITTFPKDLFGGRGFSQPEEGNEYYYVNWNYAVEKVPTYAPFEELRRRQGHWRIHSPGPDKQGPDTVGIGIQIEYDPTNGTVSAGDLVRTQIQ